MTEQYFNYTIEPLKLFILTLSEDSGHRSIFSAYLQETKRLSARDKLIKDNFEFELLHKHSTRCMVLLHGKLDNIKMHN